MEMTMRGNRFRRLGWAGGLCALIAGSVASCGGKSHAPDGPIGGSESHFLAYCDDTCGDGLACITGVCTRGCVVNEDACDDLSPNAVCTPESIEPGAVAVCDVSCEAHEDCSVISAKHTCDGGYCRKSAEPAGGGTTNDGSCTVGGKVIPSGTEVENPDSCGVCDCDEGVLTCYDDCPDRITVPPCSEGELTSDPIRVKGYGPDGNGIYVFVTHTGGCEEHAYSMCYRLDSEADPPSAELVLTHDANGDACEAEVFADLRFDSSAVLAELGTTEVAFGLPEETESGAVVFRVTQVDGCEDRRALAKQQLESLVEAYRSCNDASDCLPVSTVAVCAGVCHVYVNYQSRDEFTELLRAMDRSVCDECAEAPPICPWLNGVDCIDSVCVELE
jgi:hypothetical protein